MSTSEDSAQQSRDWTNIWLFLIYVAVSTVGWRAVILLQDVRGILRILEDAQ